MAKYSVGITYTVWVDVEAEDDTDAVNKCLEVQHDFQDTNNTGAVMELNEFDDPIVCETD